MTQPRTIGRRTLLGGAAAVLAAGLGSQRQAFAAGRGTGRIDPATVDAVAGRLDSSLIALRRQIHQHPELAGQEVLTSGLVADRFRAAGLDVRTGVGGYGVVGLLHGTRPGRTVAYRADMDAVPPDEQLNGGPAAAHVCGHDIHTTVAVGVAEVLTKLRDRLAGTVMFVCQPAEESLAGAAAMLADGVFDTVRPAEIHALHCGPFPVGTVATTSGYGLPGQDHGVINLADSTQAGRLASEIMALGTVAPPATPAELDQLVADFLVPHSPLAEFVYLQARTSGNQVQLSYRCWPPERYVTIRDDINKLAESYGATATFPADPFPALVSPKRDGHAVERYLRHTLGHDHVTPMQCAVPFSGEDFSLFLDQLPGTYTFLGVRTPGAPVQTSYPHFGSFDPDERSIGYGVRAMAGWLAARTSS